MRIWSDLRIRIAIRRWNGIAKAKETSVLPLECLLNRRARVHGTAHEACRAMHIAVELDHAQAACALMQAVDVLRDQLRDPAQRLEPRKRAVRSVRPRPGKLRPAEHAATPIAAPALLGM